MNMPHVKLVHFCSGFLGLGGVESVLKQHWEKDAAWDIDSHFLVYFEAAATAQERVHFLGLDSRSTIRGSRHQIAQIIAKIQPEVSVFHGMWGVPYLADLDQARRRILFLHGDVPRLEELVQSRGPWMDGVLCVSEPLRASVRRFLPGMDPARISFIPYPIRPPPEDAAAPRPAWGKAPLVLGFCARLLKEQKRVDRLPGLLRHLDAAKLEYRLEFLGDGPERHWLEQQFREDSRIKFHGRQSGRDYWRILSAWDAILFVSDYEGTPIALLEALSQGVIPIYPRIKSGGDAYTTFVSKELLYEPGDFPHVAAAISHLSRQSSTEMDALRNRCRESAAAHLGENYHQTFSNFLRKTLSAERVASNTFPARPFPIDLCSFASLEKLGAVRRATLKLMRQF